MSTVNERPESLYELGITTHILVAVICVSVLSIYVSTVAGLRTKMDRYVCWVSGYLALDAASSWALRVFIAEYRWLDNLIPFGLLYGPFLYVAYHIARGDSLNLKRVLLHILPFVLFLLSYVAWYTLPFLGKDDAQLFHASLSATRSLSLCSYAVWILFFKPASRKAYQSNATRMVSTMAMVLAFAAIVSLVFTYSEHFLLNARSQFKAGSLFLNMLAASVVLFSYVINRLMENAGMKKTIDRALPLEHPTDVQPNRTVDNDVRYKKSAIPVDLLTSYAESLTRLMEEESVYLDDNLSLESLAQQLRIPKHHLSQVLSVCIGKNFNHYINEYRINHAISLMRARSDMSIAQIYMSSGFTSKASFNRYFKQFQRRTPSEFRADL